MNKNIDVLIIGAGQAGLAIGYYLSKSNQSFILIDAAGRVSDVWRNRYDSLVLFSPRRYSSLPGLPLAGDSDGFPTKDEFADYMEAYGIHFSLPFHLNTKVEKLKQAYGSFEAITSKGRYSAKSVVIATGPFQKPFIPQLKGSSSTFQLHSSDYRGPYQLAEGPALIVGGGNSGAQIALELAESRQVYLSAGHEMVFIPRVLLKRSIFWWLEVTGLAKAADGSRRAKLLKKTEPVIGTELKLLIESGKVIVKERAVAFQDQEVVFKDGSKIAVDNIIWATGFYFDYSWIDIPGVLDSQGKTVHQRAISPVEGIYFLGLPWLSRVGSAQINGINYDAKNIFEDLEKRNSEN
ncbi:oxidoreductase [Planococcus sp. ANT_H30]|uniref:flavin-containing monooxygenase n=1 Tax=Planococcus sp. ANT_H30 TaxID=2597347 RepID=UPI0011ECF669|nr:NAD(P)/FAD-dependent oxidoreductase [Planococcus sp. ANT_H30]KAA0956358.1 oxidoreductase [Planococcus sp. ANT_H30]